MSKRESAQSQLAEDDPRSDPTHVDKTEVIHTYTEVSSPAAESSSTTPEVFQKCLRTTTTTTTRTTKIRSSSSPSGSQEQQSPIPGSGVEITEIVSDDDEDESSIPQPSTVTQFEQQAQKPETIPEEWESEVETRHFEVEYERDDTNQTPISLPSRDQSESNGQTVDTSELITTQIYGGEIVDEIISQAISRVNDLEPQEVEEVGEESERLIEEDEDDDFAAEELADRPPILRTDSEEPSSKSDPISVTSPEEEEVSEPLPVEPEVVVGAEGEEEETIGETEPSVQQRASSPGDSSSQQRTMELERSVSPEIPSSSSRED
ncbi:hypothetical protein Ocin01_00655 [Orchesella cincta]|uniref:Uncharacterized protein n=1 Tax=Orchesella cincta TaxID=48709 RepID=A0A1D2NLM1_ORCCI|nr:hypothetical protein Ocin01_00655 [Orchesella cincta]